MKTVSEKFQSLVQGNQFICGTSHNERKVIMNEIIAKNKETLLVEINKVEITLKAHWSLSKKTVTYSNNISKENYIKITGSELGLSKSKTPFITIQMDGRVQISGGDKHFLRITNSNITIL